MSKESLTDVIIEIASDFHDNVKTNWTTLGDYMTHGEIWVAEVKERYQCHPQAEKKAKEILLNATFQFNRNFTQESRTLGYDKIALVMKGGGIKGLAYVGALEVLDKFYKFSWYTGTSAGAITAILLGSGYSHKDLLRILSEKDFSDFKDASLFDRVYNLLTYSGMYKADSFLEWLNTLLNDRLKLSYEVKLKDLPTRTSVYASSAEKSAVIFDSQDMDSKEKGAAFAARCSMSIPFVFTPQYDGGKRIYDGGTLNNFPVELLLKEFPDTNFIGLYLGSEQYEFKKRNIFGDLMSLFLESKEPSILREHKNKIVIMDPRPIGTTQFKLSKKEKDFLVEVGRLAAINFLHNRNEIDRNDYDYDDRIGELEVIREELKAKKEKRKNLFQVVGAVILIAFIFYIF